MESGGLDFLQTQQSVKRVLIGVADTIEAFEIEIIETDDKDVFCHVAAPCSK